MPIRTACTCCLQAKEQTSPGTSRLDCMTCENSGGNSHHILSQCACRELTDTDKAMLELVNPSAQDPH